ncbi:MAG: hypothetical protein SOT07_02655 [Paludibacteraceae bacterium]|nr:hypothetical protein [Paludibacteraceae bacterium]
MDSLICRLEVLSDTSAMVYALRKGQDLCRVYYNVEKLAHTDSYHIEIPITVVDSIQ